MADFSGSSGDDTYGGTFAGDTITSGGGKDSLAGGGGSDTFIINGLLSAGSVIDGGSGIDTLVFTNLADQPLVTSPYFPDAIPASIYTVYDSVINSIEALSFNAADGTLVEAKIGFGTAAPYANQFSATGIAAKALVSGSAGRDGIALYASQSAGTVNAPEFNYSNWQAADRAYLGGDYTLVAAPGSANVVLNGSRHQGIQILAAGSGNDTITGTDDMDLILFDGGTDTLQGKGGDDTFASYRTAGAGSVPAEWKGTVDGGDGIDFLAFGASVDFRASVTGIEGIYLAPSAQDDAPADDTAAQAADTYVTMTSAVLGQLPTDVLFDGAGTIAVALVDGDGFDGSTFRFEADSRITFDLTGTGGDDIVTGTLGDDTFRASGGNDFIEGTAGKDTAVFSGLSSLYTFARGPDGTLIVTGSAGKTTLRGIEVLEFADGAYTLQGTALRPANGSGESFQLYVGTGFAGIVGGKGQVFGAGFNSIEVVGGATNVVTFDGSFSSGHDAIRLPGSSSEYGISSVGSRVLLTENLINSYSLPISMTGTSVTFDDGTYELRYDEAINAIKFGDATVTGVQSPVGKSGGTAVPGVFDPSAIGQLFMGKDTSVTVGGQYNIIGTNGHEHVTWLSGNLRFDASFNRGGDILTVYGTAGEFSAYRLGGSVVLVGEEGTASIPLGSVGMELEFAGDDPADPDVRVLRYDENTGNVVIGDQVIVARSIEDAAHLSGFTSLG